MKIILFFIAVILSVLTSTFVGDFYAGHIPHYGSFVLGINDSVKISGFFISLLFFIPIFLGIREFIRNLRLIMWLTIPVLILVTSSVNGKFFYFPLGFWLAGLGIAYLVNKVTNRL